MSDKSMLKTNKCLDCGTPISQKAKRCSFCFHKSTRGRIPHNKDKKTAFVVCVDCGEKEYHNGKIYNYNGGIKTKWLRCRSCSAKKLSKEFKVNPPVKNPTWLEKYGGHAGYKHSEETKKLFSQQRTGKLVGESNPKWVGDDVGYMGIHSWVSRKLGKQTTCEECGAKNLIEHNIHWANISGDYKRDVFDWKRLCVSCHMKHDDTGNTIWAKRRGLI